MPLYLRVVCVNSFFVLLFFSSSPLASHSAPHPAHPTTHPAPHWSSSKSLPHRRSHVLPASRATPHGAPCPPPRAPQNTPALPAASPRKNSSIHQSSWWQFPALALHKHRAPPPLPRPAGRRKSPGISAPPPSFQAEQGSRLCHPHLLPRPPQNPARASGAARSDSPPPPGSPGSIPVAVLPCAPRAPAGVSETLPHACSIARHTIAAPPGSASPLANPDKTGASANSSPQLPHPSAPRVPCSPWSAPPQVVPRPSSADTRLNRVAHCSKLCN